MRLSQSTRLIVVFAGLAAVAFAVIPGFLLPVGSAQQQGKISSEAMRQMNALLEEKEARTPAQQKIDSQLIYAIRMHSGKPVAAGVPTQAVGIAVDDGGGTVVDITATVNENLLAGLKANGAQVLSSFPQYRSIRVSVALDRLETIAALPEVIFIQPKQEGAGAGTSGRSEDPIAQWQPLLSPDFSERANRVRARLLSALPRIQQQSVPAVGSVTSQGDTAHKASNARASFGGNGAGVRIGVMSDGVNTLATSQGTNDLGPVTILPGQGGSGNEGTAMLEIVHDIAPGAELYFASSASGLAAMAQNIRDLRAAGCDIIIDDWTFFVESPFHNGQAPSVISTTNAGQVVEAVNDVTASGCLYFSDAANAGNKNDGTSGTVESDFVNGGALALTPGGNVHDFDPGAGVSQFDNISLGSSAGTNAPLSVHWSDPLGGSNNDYDLFILNSAGTAVIGSSTNIQNGTQDPIELIQVATLNATNNKIVVLQKTGAADRFLHVNTYRGRLTFNTPGETRGHNAIGGNSNHFGVAASNAGAGAAYTSANVVESFSSDGPRRVFFNSDSTAITPGDFSSTGGTVLQKPDITAADGVSTTAPGFTTFFGTSAAAPHAGAIAGLLKSQFPNMTPAQIRTVLVSTAVDIETAGVDRDSGAGIVMAFEALQSQGAVASANFELVTATATETCCNANGIIEPGEGATLNVQLKNSGVVTATAISATLSTTTPGVSVTNSTSAYPDTASPAGTSTNTTPFRFSLAETFICDTAIDFKMTINYAGGNSPKVVRFAVPLIARQSITTTLDATAPTPSSDYPISVTGTQTGRLNRFTPSGACNNVEVCPGLAAATGARQYDAYTFTNPTAFATCASVTYTTSCNAALFAVAYSGSFDPANLCANYLSDGGSSAVANIPGGFSFNVPAGGTVVVVVHEVNTGGGIGCTYTLRVGGVCKTAPSAAPAAISGRITKADGSPLGGVTIDLDGGQSARVITDSNGSYHFDNLETGGFYTVTPSLSNYHFSPANRSFSLVSNQTDAAFTANADAVPGANAIDSAEYFVRQQYLDFLGREPDQGGFDYWTSQFTQCSGNATCILQKRIDVSAAFFMSGEFQDTGSYVYDMYAGLLGRTPGYGEFTPDRAQVVGGSGLDAAKAAFAGEFIQRAEFISRYPQGLTREQFVDAVLQTMQQRSGVDLSSQRGELLTDYDNGGRALVARHAAESAMFVSAEYNKAFVLMEYFGYLRRGEDTNGYAFWLNVLNQGSTNNYRGMVCSFLTSTEYQHRFSSVVTHNNGECQ